MNYLIPIIRLESCFNFKNTSSSRIIIYSHTCFEHVASFVKRIVFKTDYINKRFEVYFDNLNV